MLIEFRVENHRSLRDEQVLTMEAGRSGAESDPRPRHVPGHSESLLPIAVLYGANASGKSNVLAALGFMRDAVLESHRFWPPDEGVPRDPFAWGQKRDEPSLFEVTVLLDAVRYQYGFVASDDGFLEEWLHAWPNGKKQVWFERDGHSFKFGENFKGENRLIEEVTRSNALFLSTAVQLKHQQIQVVYAWFLNLININIGRSFYRLPSAERWLSQLMTNETRQPITSLPEDSLVNDFRTLIKASDVGIVDFKVVESESHETEPFPRITRQIRVLLKHQCASDAWLPLEKESKGTQTLFRITLPVLQAIQTGGILLIDELEASLHPSLAQKIVQQFNDPVTNPRNAQLIFTTHDTNLIGTTLGEPALRRDQVWLTEKDGEGATVLYPLSDYKPRKAENLERGYLQGRYGAIPFLGDFTVAGE